MKKEAIVERLLQAGHITIEEAKILLESPFWVHTATMPTPTERLDYDVNT